MRITSSYLYPDFTSKRKNNYYSSKKSAKKDEKSFEEYLQNYTKQISNDNYNNKKVRQSIQ